MLKHCAIACLLFIAACEEPGSVAQEPGKSAAVEAKPACNAKKLDALLERLTESGPRARRTHVADGLLDACSTPKSFEAFFAATAPERLDDERPQVQASLDTANAVCPSWRTVQTSAKGAMPNVALSLIYNQCKFADMGLIGLEAWVASRPTSVVPFVAYGWLQEQGISSKSAATVAKAMLLRDRMTWAVSEQSLARVDDPLPPVPHGPVVLVARDEISLEGERIAAMSNGVPGADLFALDRKDTRLNKIALRYGSSVLPAVVVADSTIQTSTLSAVVKGLSMIGFEEAALVAEHRPLEFGAATVLIVPRPWNLSLEVTASGFEFSRGEDDISSPVEPTTAEHGPHDFKALAREVKTFVSRDKPTQLSIVSSDETTVATLLKAIAVVHASVCEEGESICANLEIGFVAKVRAPQGALIGPNSVGETVLDGSAEGAPGAGDGRAVRGLGRKRKVPFVRTGRVMVGDGLDATIVRRIIRAHMHELRLCYSTALKDEPTLEDVVTATFKIEGSGKVRGVTTKSRESNNELAKCFAEGIKRWTFPRPTGGATLEVTYPFELSPPPRD